MALRDVLRDIAMDLDPDRDRTIWSLEAVPLAEMRKHRETHAGEPGVIHWYIYPTHGRAEDEAE